MRHNLYHIPPEQGPKIVGIGGGTGLSTLLRGLKLYTRNITAIVTVADDGGSTGMLRQDLGMAAPGDIRSCLQSLANCEPLMAQLMAYRFADGTLAGQSLGNLLLAALNDIMPSFDKAVAGLSKVLALPCWASPIFSIVKRSRAAVSGRYACCRSIPRRWARRWRPYIAPT